MRASVGALLALSALLAAGCHGRRGEERGEQELALAAADGLYDQRVELERLVEGQQALLSLLARSPDDPQVLWRLARGYSAYGYGAPGASGGPCGSPGPADPELCYALAMEYAFRCMDTNPAWSSRLAINDGQISERIAAALGSEERDCVQQAVLAWVRWVALRGPSADLYLGSISQLARRSVALDAGSWIGRWGMGMTQALPPPLAAPNLEAAAEQLDVAVGLSPALATARTDRLVYVLALREDTGAVLAEIEAIQREYADSSSGEYALENRRSMQRLDALKLSLTSASDSP